MGAGDSQRVELRIAQLVLDEEPGCRAVGILPLGMRVPP